MHVGDIRNGTRVLISHITNHPKYNEFCPGRFGDFDFSVIHLATPVQFDDKVIPACLPNGDLAGDALDGKTLTVSGWGHPHPGVLHKAQYPGQTNENCTRINAESWCKEMSGASENMLCAGNPYEFEGASSRGDSGGKMLIKY